MRAGCLGLCGAGPAVVTYPRGDVHIRVTPADAPELAASVTGEGTVARPSITVPAWYRQHIVGRLGAYVDLLRRRWAASASSGGSG